MYNRKFLTFALLLIVSGLVASAASPGCSCNANAEQNQTVTSSK